MNSVKRIAMLGLVSMATGTFDIGGGFLPIAEARVGRPLTPVSVAGVARRTVRRCAVGVYYCATDKAPVKLSVLPVKLTSQRPVKS